MYSKSILILGCVVLGVFAAPADVPPEKLQPTVIPIVSQSDELEPNGTYKFSYETGNGITREETAYEKILPESAKTRGDSSSEEGEDDGSGSNEIHVQRGSYSYTAPDGTVISVRYIADENGFQPIGDHIPRSLVTIPGSNSAEKSSPALKIADSSESSSTPVKAKVAGKPSESTVKEVKPEASSPTPAGNTELVSAPILAAKENNPASAPAKSSENIQTEANAAAKETTNKPNSAFASTTEQNEAVSTPAVPVQETRTGVETSTTEKSSEDKTLLKESAQTTTEAASTATESNLTTVSGPTTATVDVSTEAASTAASTQSSTETEQTSTASAESASTSSPEQTTSAEVSEQSSSTSAPEPTSSSEVVGPSTSTESVDQSTKEEAGQASTNAPEVVSTEEPRSTSVTA